MLDELVVELLVCVPRAAGNLLRRGCHRRRSAQVSAGGRGRVSFEFTPGAGGQASPTCYCKTQTAFQRYWALPQCRTSVSYRNSLAKRATPIEGGSSALHESRGSNRKNDQEFGQKHIDRVQRARCDFGQG